MIVRSILHFITETKLHFFIENKSKVYEVKRDKKLARLGGLR